MSPIPLSPSLEQLKNQAKDFLKAYRSDDPQARRRAQASLSQPTRPTPAGSHRRGFQLSDALLIIAREHGFSSWPRLKAAVEATARNAEPGAPSGTVSPPTESKASLRRQFIRELATEIAELARRREVEQLAGRCSRTPLRDILSVRAILAEGGDYPLLVDALIAGLRHDNPKVRYNCAGAMDHFADDRCVEPLRYLLNDAVPRVRRMALHSLTCAACKMVPLEANDDIIAVLTEHALADPSINVRRHAVSGLGGYCHDARAVSTLETLLAQETDPVILRNARWALHSQGGLAPKGQGQQL